MPPRGCARAILSPMALLAEVTFVLPQGSTATLRPGDLIGRGEPAALVISDPRVSEAHALVSLRRGELYLLSLRRMLGVRGKPVSEVRLEPGISVELSEGLALGVVAVRRPKEVLAICNDVLGVRPLAEVTSLLAGPPPKVIGRFVPEADVHVWSTGRGDWVMRRGVDTQAVEPGTRLEVGKECFHFMTTPLADHSVPATQRDGRLEQPLSLVVYYDSVELHRPDQPPVVLPGVAARILSELVAFSGPVNWETLAREIWSDSCDTLELRHRWDVALGRLRGKLRTAGVRGDLIRSDGSGQLQLLLYERDRVIERM